MSDTKSTAFKSRLVSDFILQQFDNAGVKERRPLMVSMQGPQGAGKTTLVTQLVQDLKVYGLSTAVASLDDFYLDHDSLVKLSQRHPHNGMLQGRGPPGTHDTRLLKQVLSQVISQGWSTTPDRPILLPSFDKSLFDGQGDRSPTSVRLTEPIHVFVLEGWSLGYSALRECLVKDRWKAGPLASQHALESILQVNRNLAEFCSETDAAFDCHVAIRPDVFAHVYRWRLQQEREMKLANGGQGMTDDAVRAFVDRYMPVYEIFGATEPARPTMVLRFGPDREVI